MLIETTREGVTLRRLTPSDAEEYSSLLRSNEAHLTRLGNYVDEVATPTSVYAQQFADDGPVLAFAICEAATMVGGTALVPVDPPKYGLGYWLAADACGRGLANVALAALADFAFQQLGATDLFAGVTHGNEKSAAVLERNGFRIVADFADYTRFHLAQPDQGDHLNGAACAAIWVPATPAPGRNTYKVSLTRGVRGTVVHSTDDETRELWRVSSPSGYDTCCQRPAGSCWKTGLAQRLT
ncbi:MAG: GNAT family N-acetyltransferase [Nocardioidaceae bacterium]|nr:GNAT family N-acetyltransferase [Nocardioidaceae bacterium]